MSRKSSLYLCASFISWKCFSLIRNVEQEWTYACLQCRPTDRRRANSTIHYTTPDDGFDGTTLLAQHWSTIKISLFQKHISERGAKNPKALPRVWKLATLWVSEATTLITLSFEQWQQPLDGLDFFFLSSPPFSEWIYFNVRMLGRETEAKE